MKYLAKRVFVTSGVGEDVHELVSFENALKMAKMNFFNIVSVSSIIPPQAELVPREGGLQELDPGQVVFSVVSRNSTNVDGDMIYVAVAAAFPKDRRNCGYVAEDHGKTKFYTGNEAVAEKMARQMMGDVEVLSVVSTAQQVRGARGIWKTVLAMLVLVG